MGQAGTNAMARYDSDPHLQDLIAMLREIMGKSPNRHLPEERDCIASELAEKAFPFLTFLMKADEQQATRMIALHKFWFEEAYTELLKDYPDATGLATSDEQQDHEVKYEAEKSGKSKDEVKEMFKEVGNSCRRVEEELGKTSDEGA